MLKQWHQRNERAIALIGLSLADFLVHHIDFKFATKEFWEKLEGIFNNKVTNSKVFLKLKFYDVKTHNNEELSDHLSKFGSVIQHLASLKCETDDEDKMAVLIKSMRGITQFEQTLNVLSLEATTFEDLVALLIARKIKETKKKNKLAAAMT